MQVMLSMLLLTALTSWKIYGCLLSVYVKESGANGSGNILDFKMNISYQCSSKEKSVEKICLLP